MNRADSEKKAYDEGSVFECSYRWHKRFEHVFTCPNSMRSEKVFEDLIKQSIAGKKVLDIGCGQGDSSVKLLGLGAGYVHGIDISQRFFAEAKEKEINGRLDFSNADVMQPIPGTFDLIVGRAILHHIEFKSVLKRLYKSNLNEGGMMVFMEPFGDNLLIRLFHKIAKSAHTPTEKPFVREDLNWLRENFPDSEILPMNYVSLPVGIISSLLFSDPDNFIMRFCDKVDMWVAQNVKFLLPHFRAGIIAITKKGGPLSDRI